MDCLRYLAVVFIWDACQVFSQDTTCKDCTEGLSRGRMELYISQIQTIFENTTSAKTQIDESLVESACYKGLPDLTSEEPYPVKVKGQSVPCDPTFGGWLVFVRRQDGSEEFRRDWDDYKRGFGDHGGEFWLGNELLHQITTRWRYRLRADVTDLHGNRNHAEYALFRVEDEASGYRLTVTGFHGGSTAADAMTFHHGQMFSTKDRDNAGHAINCAHRDNGGWWYDECNTANPTGLYTNDTEFRGWGGVRWSAVNPPDTRSMRSIELKLRPDTV